MSRADVVRLRHMIDAAKDAVFFSEGKQASDLATDRKLSLALVKSIEIIGEAATRVSPETRSKSPDIPWVDIVSMRNRLIHAYFDINLDILWKTVSEELPPLIVQIEKLLDSFDH